MCKSIGLIITSLLLLQFQCAGRLRTRATRVSSRSCQRSRSSRRYGVVSLLCSPRFTPETLETVRTDGQLLGEHKTRLEQHMSTPRETQALAGWSRLNKQELESVELELLQLKRTSTKEYSLCTLIITARVNVREIQEGQGVMWSSHTMIWP